jgi:hypothetical protein
MPKMEPARDLVEDEEEILVQPRSRPAAAAAAAALDSLAPLLASLTLQPSPPRLLVILDLNGLLCERVRVVHGGNITTSSIITPDVVAGQFQIYHRPHAASFIDFLFSRFDVGVWSSARIENIRPILNHLIAQEEGKHHPHLIFVWGQAECQQEAPQPHTPKKPTFLKPLSKVYAKFPQYIGRALLIDDSPIKARDNPEFTAIHPKEWTRDLHMDDALAPHGALRQYLTRLAEAQDSLAEFVKANPFS